MAAKRIGMVVAKSDASDIISNAITSGVTSGESENVLDTIAAVENGESPKAGTTDVITEADVRNRAQKDFHEHRDREAEKRKTTADTEVASTPDAVLESSEPTPTVPETPAAPAIVTPAAPYPGAVPFKLGEVSVWDGRTAVISQIYPDGSIAVAVQRGVDQLPEVLRLRFPRPSEATAVAPEPVDPIADALSRGERVPMLGMTVAYIHATLDPVFEQLTVYRARITEVISISPTVVRLAVYDDDKPPTQGPDTSRVFLSGCGPQDNIERLNGEPRGQRFEYCDIVPIGQKYEPQRIELLTKNLVTCRCGARVPLHSLVATEIGGQSLKACVACVQQAQDEFAKLLESAILTAKA
ncbi:hypothetical protein SAMN05444166_0141 [Singulisphaera sp. GP187]|uniref:hypothetical protein n=1 Tax=Singulisphaera sp. GP187 TaxID=1882752 RepID=UPI000929C96C|nr:hypothetical protein [Singulisphaera sp. GP187]SIN69011.1 hypothetical protein SAMN05444166_0141 [Singulisphaera sp. GP187]